MNWKQKLKKVAETLGLTAKLEAKTLSNEEFQQIMDAYQRDYQVTLQDDVEAAGREQQQAAQQQAQQQLLDSIYAAVVAADPAATAAAAPAAPAAATVSGGSAAAPAAAASPATEAGIIAAINRLGENLRTMAATPAADQAQQQGTVIVSLHGPGTTPEHLFGIPAPMFSMNLRWNQIAANPRMAAAMPEADDSVYAAFRQAVAKYGASLCQRAAYLQANKMTADLKALSEGKFSTSYDGVDNLGDMGTQFTVRRQDAIIARVFSVRRLTDYFPVRYGIQDNDIIFNAFFDEVSQAWQAGEHYKGGMKIENERGYVDDAMIKMKWGPMKELERKYIAYLNTSGSDPIKWNMVEYQILNTLVVAQNEQNKRRMRGIFVQPEEGKVGSYLNASTGIIYRLLDYVHGNKLLLNDDELFRSYTKSTMLTVVKAFVDDVVANLAEDETLDGKVLYLNERHRPWWIYCLREKYHLDTDFKGVDGMVNHVPDTEVPIIWLPYLGSLPFMMIQEPGNLQFLEFVPGEMMALKTEQQMEMVRAWSTWKEGTSAAFIGRKFPTRQALVDNAFEWQQIFLNKFAATVDADATTIDAADGFWQLTGANTEATALTDITGAKAGVAYCIECGVTANATTIAKSGKFANITAAWTPTAKGDYIMVVLRSDGNFAELERMVGGVRTINRALQPHYVG